ncbi:hypothetical protein EVAR_51968_1 [Eumeta japonica]|uniref:Uncharacterized protein n=1 Tax=Eumeta variegata TaxID=151549 RepID=A0A4C1Y5W7_EUMVA|nr:hypothetical protein EVAR_51968_1 [Eumeta japonica]
MDIGAARPYARRGRGAGGGLLSLRVIHQNVCSDLGCARRTRSARRPAARQLFLHFKRYNVNSRSTSIECELADAGAGSGGGRRPALMKGRRLIVVMYFRPT